MDSKNQLIQDLQNRICSVEVGQRAGAEQLVASGCRSIDRLLPAGGYRRGSLVQWLTGGGNGADYLSLLAAKEACRDGGSLVVIDQTNQFYPPAAAALGLPLERVVILRDSTLQYDGVSRPSSLRTTAAANHRNDDFLWSIDQALRCPAVAAVWGALETIHERWFRRFQLSAESSGCIGLFIQPLAAASAPTWADVQWQVRSVPSAERAAFEFDRNEQPVQLTLNRCRGTFAGQAVCLGINTVTGDVQEAQRSHEPISPSAPANRLPVVPQLAHPTTSRQSA